MKAPVSGIIPAVNDFPQLRLFLKSECSRCVLMHWRISDLDTVFSSLHSAGKTALIHCDLISGLAPDEAGTAYLVVRLHPEGIISTKAAAIDEAKTLGVTAVQRVFLIDSAALSRSAASVARTKPDYVEFLPAPCPALYSKLRATFGVPLIAGGLISTADEAREILSRREIEAVTVSMSTLSRG